MSARPRRKSPRLHAYDYSQSGAYFVTLCTSQRIACFGAIANGIMIFSPLGAIAHRELMRIPERWSNIDLDLFVVMPNHIHAIIVIDNAVVGTPFLASEPLADGAPTLGQIIGAYKAGVTRLARAQTLLDADRLWQGRYHDHIIRSESDLRRIREYVINNPARWREDTFYSD